MKQTLAIYLRAYNKFAQLYSIHQIEAYFVVRAKTNLQYKAIKWRRKLPQNVLSDSTIEMTTYKSSKDYPKSLRLVRYCNDEQCREFVFLTNAMHISALMVAELYKNRWQIGLFFKWLKRHLKIMKFGGTTENAVRIQIYVAISTYLLVSIQCKYGQIPFRELANLRPSRLYPRRRSKTHRNSAELVWVC